MHFKNNDNDDYIVEHISKHQVLEKKTLLTTSYFKTFFFSLIWQVGFREDNLQRVVIEI